jgi:hypothetical protein
MASVTAPLVPVAVHQLPAVVHPVPTGAGYSVVLLLHVACAVVGFGAVVMTGVEAQRARQGPAGPRADGVLRYFRPGVNWAGRALYGVPVFGFVLIAASQGAFSSNDGFVVAGLGLWALATVVAEVVVWPGERRIQEALAAGWESSGGPSDADCRRLAGSAALLGAIFVVAFVLMVAQP